MCGWLREAWLWSFPRQWKQQWPLANSQFPPLVANAATFGGPTRRNEPHNEAKAQKGDWEAEKSRTRRIKGTNLPAQGHRRNPVCQSQDTGFEAALSGTIAWPMRPLM